jgi:hypothetical protein
MFPFPSSDEADSRCIDTAASFARHSLCQFSTPTPNGALFPSRLALRSLLTANVGMRGRALPSRQQVALIGWCPRANTVPRRSHTLEQTRSRLRPRAGKVKRWARASGMASGMRLTGVLSPSSLGPFGRKARNTPVLSHRSWKGHWCRLSARGPGGERKGARRHEDLEVRRFLSRQP